MRLPCTLLLSMLLMTQACSEGGDATRNRTPAGQGAAEPGANAGSESVGDGPSQTGADASNEMTGGASDASSLPRELPVCGTVLPSEGAVNLEPTPVPLLVEPSAGQRYADPTFGHCITRLTDHAAEPPERFARNTYSRTQAFNADSSRVLIQSGDGGWHLYDPVAVRHVATLAGLRGAIEPLWHPSLPDRLFHLPEEGRGMQLLQLDIASGEQRVVADLGRRLRARWPTAVFASTRSEGAPSRDANTWVWLVEDAARRPLGLVTWDRTLDRIIAMRELDATTGSTIDWVSMTPSGRFVIVAGTSRTVAFDRTLGLHGVVHEAVEHADLALDAAGNDVYVSVDFVSLDGWLFTVDIASLVRTDLISMYNIVGLEVGFTSLHVSGKAYRRPGWAVISTYRTRSTRTEWFQDKVMLVELAARPRIRRLADHQSRYNGYWTEPHASPNHDLSQVLFNSNWNSGSETDVDTWRIEVDPAVFTPR